MEKKQINSRRDAITKDMTAGEPGVESFTFPSLGVTVEASSMAEALEIAKAKTLQVED